MTGIKKVVNRIGLPTLIIAVFFIAILIAGAFLDLSVGALLSDTIKRVGMNGILVLAMLPSIQSGTGPNFALPIGISCGLFAITVAIAFDLTGVAWLIAAIGIGVILAVGAGFLYGKLLNAVKGAEMTIATYTGFSVVAFMCLIWLVVPFNSSKMKWFIGDGLRETIQLDVVEGAQILNNFLSFKLFGIAVPTGMILIFLLCCFLIWLFFKTKTGIAITAVGSSEKFSTASGLNIDKYRIIANMLSTVLASIGIIVYSQSYGYAQLYNAPLTMAFAAIAAILIGGATAQKAKVSHVIIGVFLFQGLLTSALPVANKIFVGSDLSDTMRMIIQNGIILYALTHMKGGGK